jgi:hypothetical protein
MSTSQFEVNHDSRTREPYLWFDTWQCPRCGNVVTDRSYKQIITDVSCVCRQTRLSRYRFVKAKMKKDD